MVGTRFSRACYVRVRQKWRFSVRSVVALCRSPSSLSRARLRALSSLSRESRDETRVRVVEGRTSHETLVSRDESRESSAPHRTLIHSLSLISSGHVSGLSRHISPSRLNPKPSGCPLFTAAPFRGPPRRCDSRPSCSGSAPREPARRGPNPHRLAHRVHKG